MTSLILMITMCGQLMLVVVHGEAGTVYGSPDFLRSSPVAEEVLTEVTKGPVDKGIIKWEDLVGAQCG